MKYLRYSERCCGFSLWSAAYRNPLDENNHVGPLIDTHAVEMYNNALTKVAEGGKIVAGGVLSGEGYESGCYVKPAIETENTFEIVQHETFAPFYIY
jgi:aldehyde dehydrogenase (NAD+)